MKRIGILMLVFIATILLPVSRLNAQGHQWLDDPGPTWPLRSRTHQLLNGQQGRQQSPRVFQCPFGKPA